MQVGGTLREIEGVKQWLCKCLLAYSETISKYSVLLVH